MTKSQQRKSNRIRESVFMWYSDSNHKNECDRLYDIAKSETIIDIYEKTTELSEINTLFAKTDLLILTANKYERNMLHSLSYLETNERIKEIDLTLNTASKLFNQVSAYSFSIYGYTVLNIHSRVTGAYTNGGAADVIRYMLSSEYLFPAAVISFGICFGMKERKASLGDVVLSKKVYPYFIGAKVKGEQLAVTDDNMFSIQGDLAKALEDLEGKNQLNKSALGFDVVFGNYITGEAVVSSAKYRERYEKTTTQPIDAGDMEAYGVFKECNTPPYSIPCIVVKAICDWAIEKNYNVNDQDVIADYCKIVLKCNVENLNEERHKEIIDTIGSLMDRLQAYAAGNSFAVLRLLLNNSVFGHSAYYSFINIIREKTEQVDFQKETWSMYIFEKKITGILSTYHYAVPRGYVKLIAETLANEQYIFDYQPTKAKGFTFSIENNYIKANAAVVS